MRRRNISVAVGAALAVVAAFLLLRASPVRVEMGVVSRGPLQVTVDEEGRTRVRDRFVISAPIAGRVSRIALDAGDAVEPGTVVSRMHPAPLDPRARVEAQARLDAAAAAQRAADARVEQARAALDQARRGGARARHLGAKGTISAERRELVELEETARQRELEAATFAARAAAYDVEAARAPLLAADGDDRAAAATCETHPEGCVELRSPVHGQVLRVPEKSERVVSPGTPLLEVGDPTTLEIVVDVLSADAVQVTPGTPVLVENWGGARALRARVRRVEPSGFTKLSALGVEEQRVNVIADFVDQAAPLADGYRVDVRIVVWESRDVLRVPVAALFQRAGRWSAFTVHAGRARAVALDIGHRGADEAEILGGIAAGAPVILHPGEQVADGVRVAPL